MRVTDTASFIVKSKIVHGDRYDYSRSIYSKAKEKIEIRCIVHGSFFQTADSHSRGAGCPICAGSKKSNTQDFTKKAKKIHGDKYDYSISVYVNAITAININCKKHGVFSITPNKHLGGQGCPCCKKGEFYNSESLESYSARANAIHKNKFIYLRKYSKNMSGKKKSVIEYMCKSHGLVVQSAYGHLNGNGCVRCSRELAGQYSVMTTQEFIEKSRMKHGDRYDYSESVYFRAASKLKIRCKKHGVFLQTPNRHTGGSGCKKCADEAPRQGWSRSGFAANCGNRIAKVYLVEMKSGNESFFKIGITCNSVKGRFYDSPYQVKIISHIESSPERVFDIEKEMHRKLRGKKHKPSIPFKGMTECFSELTDEVLEFFGVVA